MTALPCMETGLDSENDAPTTMQPLNAELMQTLEVISLAYSDGMATDEIQADVMVQKRKIVQQTIDILFDTGCVKYESNGYLAKFAFLDCLIIRNFARSPWSPKYRLASVIAKVTFNASEGTEDEIGTSDDKNARSSWNVPCSLSGDVLHVLNTLHSYFASSNVREAIAADFYSFEAYLLDDIQKMKTQCKVTDILDHA